MCFVTLLTEGSPAAAGTSPLPAPLAALFAGRLACLPGLGLAPRALPRGLNVASRPAGSVVSTSVDETWVTELMGSLQAGLPLREVSRGGGAIALGDAWCTGLPAQEPGGHSG